MILNNADAADAEVLILIADEVRTDPKTPKQPKRCYFQICERIEKLVF